MVRDIGSLRCQHLFSHSGYNFSQRRTHLVGADLERGRLWPLEQSQQFQYTVIRDRKDLKESVQDKLRRLLLFQFPSGIFMIFI